MKAPLKNLKNETVGELELSDAVFAAEEKASTVYEAIRNSLNNKRHGTSATLNRALVHGTTKKPWRQKGTGRARAGSNKSPLWRGAAIIFGPHPKSWRYDIPQKVKQTAWRTALSQLQAASKLLVVDQVPIVEAKTKPLAAALSKLTGSRKVLFIVDGADKANYEKLRRAARNISWLKTTHVDSAEIQDLFYTEVLVITKTALESLQKRLS